MSVIRQPDVLGRATRRRVVGVTAVLSTAGVETLAVCLWFGIVVGSRTAATALAGMGLLLCGSFLRAGVFAAAVGDERHDLLPGRLTAALALTGGWIGWFAVAEWIGGAAGLLVGGVLLTGALTAQFALERRVFRTRAPDPGSLAALVPGALLAVGASVLLASAWFVDWTLLSASIPVAITTVVISIEGVQLGAVAFGLFAVLAHRQRVKRWLEH